MNISLFNRRKPFKWKKEEEWNRNNSGKQPLSVSQIQFRFLRSQFNLKSTLDLNYSQFKLLRSLTKELIQCKVFCSSCNFKLFFTKVWIKSPRPLCWNIIVNHHLFFFFFFLMFSIYASSIFGNMFVSLILRLYSQIITFSLTARL